MDSEHITDLDDNDSSTLSWSVLPEFQSTTGTIERLYGAPPFIDSESFSGWIFRIAAQQGWSPEDVSLLLGCGPDPTQFDYWSAPLQVERIAEATLSDVSKLAHWFSFAALRFTDVPTKFLVSSLDGAPILRFCGRCLEQDEIPYIRRHWRLATTLVCDQHDIGLSDRCPACGSRFRITGNTPLNPEVHGRDAMIFHCRECFTPLTETEHRKIPPQIRASLVSVQRLVINCARYGVFRDPIRGTTSAARFLLGISKLVYEPRFDEVCYSRERELDWTMIIGTPHQQIFRDWIEGFLSTYP